MMVAGGIAHERGRNEQAAQDEAYDEPPPPPPAPPPPAASPAEDATSEIERLAALHDAGSLSDDEFAAAKSKILGI